MSEVRSVTLGEVTRNFDAKRVPIKTSERVPGPYPYYGASGIIDKVESYIYDGEYLLIAEDGENLRTRSTPVAFLARGQFWVNNHAHVVKGNDLADTRFLSYLLSITDIGGYLTGSTQPKLTRAAMDSIRIRIPSLARQLAIAEVLGALDDKIAANTQLSSTVDQFLGALFARVTDDIPTIRLSEIANVNPGSCKPISGGSLRYIDISSVGQGAFEFPAVSSWDEAPSRARRHIQGGDTLWSTVRPNRRSHALNLSDDDLLVGSTGLAVLRPREVGFAYLYEATKTSAFTAYLENVAEGSAYPAVRTNRFDDAPISWAATSERESFEIVAAPLRRTQHSLDGENLRLSSVRAALLPQLMSGKLHVKEAAEVVAAAI